jgi:hypothetical protein
MKNTFNHNQTTSMLNCYPSRDNGKKPSLPLRKRQPLDKLFSDLGILIFFTI